MRENENKLLVVKISESDDPDNAEKLLFATLQQRHMRERIELEEIFEGEKESAVISAKAELEEARQLEKEEISAAQDKVSLFLILSYFIINETSVDNGSICTY